MNNLNDTNEIWEFNRLVDPEHSWLDVPQADVRFADVQITSFSPRKKGRVYLEEDVDMYMFINALKAKGITVEMNTVRIENFDVYIGRYAQV
jgi:hypothetical protein